MAMATENTAVRVLELATGELGAISGDKYIKYYNEVTGSNLPYGVAWCAAWVTWVMRHAGVPIDSVLNYKGCATASEWFANQGRFRHRSSGYVPKPGDIIMYEWNPQNEGTPHDDGDDHTGIVEYLQNGKVHTIEGNNGGKCSRDWWSLGNSCISGYCVPLYNIKNKEEEDMTEAQTQAIVKKAVEEQMKKLEEANPTYHKLEDVPDYWREDIRELVAQGIILGGINGDLELKRSEAKAAVIVKRALDKLNG